MNTTTCYLLDNPLCALRVSGIETTQLAAGQFEQLEQQLTLGQVGLSYEYFPHKARFRAAAGPGRVCFAFQGPESGSMRFCGQEVGPESIAIYRDAQIETVTENSHSAFALSTTDEHLSRLIDQINSAWVPDLFSRKRYLFVTETGKLDSVRAQILSQFRNPNPDTKVGDELLTDVLNAIARPADPTCGRTRLRLERAIACMDADPQRMVRIKDIAEEVGLSWRSLEYHFKAHYGVTPKSFLRYNRLHAVRMALLDGWPGTVTEAAQHYGFSHLGEFAGAYRAAFHELPSETFGRQGQFFEFPIAKPIAAT